MSPVELFGVATVGVAVSDFMLWERMNFNENLGRPDDEQRPLFFRPALRIEGFQFARWVTLGALFAASIAFPNSRAHGLLIGATLILFAVHMLLGVRRFGRQYASRIHREPTPGDVKQ